MALTFPFSAIVGQDEMKRAILIAAVDPSIGGVLVFGDRGTGKSGGYYCLTQSSARRYAKQGASAPVDSRAFGRVSAHGTHCPVCAPVATCHCWRVTNRMMTP